MNREAVGTFRRLLESLHPYPRMQFLLFAKNWGALEEELLRYCEAEDHSILLYRLEGLPAEDLPESERIRQRPYRIDQPRYNLQGKLYNHAFVTALPPEAPADFARKVYTGIVNAGGLYLLLERKDLEAWEAALTEANYVATSTIDLSGDLLLLHGRKMHGWGGS